MEYHSGGSLPLLGRPRYCPGANANGGYLCETGHCCGESGCCTYYYELWWFWLLWTVLILFSCCCAYRHRRAKLRVQQQQRQRDISLLAYQGASSFPSSMLDLSFLASLKLPSYEEVAAQPSTPPPPYSSVFTAPRYPQPPRAAHPHLLSQHPGAAQHPGALHRPLQPLSDGPSSLSSDNSSSCSCDSCCPSSPCSSSLSAPVTYETDTSHASTPSEATPLALDPVAMETISAAAARLTPTLSSKDDCAAVAILIEQTTPAPGATECVAAVTAAAAASQSPSETNALPDLDTMFPVGITAPIKQQPDITPTASGPTCLQSTEHSPSPDEDLTRTLDHTSFKQPRTLPLILDSGGGNADTNPSLVPISVSGVPKVSPITSPSQASPSRTPPPSPPPSKSPNLTDLSPPSQGIAHFPSKPARESSELSAEAPSVAEQSAETGLLLTSPSITTETTEQAPVDSLEETTNLQDFSDLSKQTSELSKPSETVAPHADQMNDKDTSATGNSSLSQTPLELAHPAQTSNQLSKSQATTTSPVSTAHDWIAPDVDAKIPSPTFTETTLPEPAESVSISVPDPSNSERPPSPSEQRQNCHRPEDTASGLQFFSEIPLPTQDPSLKANSLAADVSPTLDQEMGKLSIVNFEEKCSRLLCIGSELNLERPLTSLSTENEDADSSCTFFPAITIHADPPSFAASPCSIPSPSLPQSPPGAMLLLDPLAALQPSDKSAPSSGHASSLSPSPRNTQSPPKQTLFSPCVDVFEPVNPNWEDDESEEQPDEEYCEDSDVAADESQYRHRRLTGDSGIEVCRCRVEDEDEDEEEEMEKAKIQDGREKRAPGGTELHDSVDCPVRSRRSSSGDAAALCSNDTSNDTLAIPVETM